MFLKVTVFFCFVAVAVAVVVVVVAAGVPTVDDVVVAPFGLGLEPLATAAAAFFELGTVSVAASLVI